VEPPIFAGEGYLFFMGIGTYQEGGLGHRMNGGNQTVALGVGVLVLRQRLVWIEGVG
jgi:hypothetical protein